MDSLAWKVHLARHSIETPWNRHGTPLAQVDAPAQTRLGQLMATAVWKQKTALIGRPKRLEQALVDVVEAAVGKDGDQIPRARLLLQT
jgi:hypothetical protein